MAPPIDPPAIAEPRPPVDVWDRRVAGALAFLRNRLTGDYDVDEFGFDQELTDGVFFHCCAACTGTGSGSRCRARRTCRPTARRWWSRTTRA